MELPEVQDVRRWAISPGDRLIVRLDVVRVDEQTADFVKQKIRTALRLPEDFPVLVTGRDVDFSVSSEGG